MKKLLLVLLALPLIGFGQNVNIPDANFKACLLGNTAINTNGDTVISVTEATAFTGTIDCSYDSISNLTGIEAFTALTGLFCGANQLTSLNVSQNTALIYLYCGNNQLTSLNVNQNTALIDLVCGENQLTSLNVTQNTALTSLDCWNNQLTSLNVNGATALTSLDCEFNQLDSLNVSQNTALTHLDCQGNLLTSLDVQYNTVLTFLSCSSNQLDSLDVSQNTALTLLGCGYNQITSLDVSQNTALTYLKCEGNLLSKLSSLDVRNGNNTNIYDFEAQNNPNLYCINVDDATWSTANWTVANGMIDPQHYFSNNCPPSAIQEQTTNKELLKITDLLGRETKATNQLLFYIYDDGTVEKKIVIE